jgi:glycosyltransferase involved in cell wall biosynthesis
MRIVHVHRISGIGGSERHLLALLPALRAHGIEPSFVGLDDPRGDAEPFYAALEAAGIPFARVPASHDLDPRLPFRIARAARPFRPDLVHTHLVHADVHGAAASVLLRTPLVSTKHNDDPFRAGAFRYVARLLARRARRIVAITESLARFNAERVGIPRAKLVVVHYGLDAPPARWADNPPLALPDDARVLLALGRLVPQKGLDVAVRALSEVRRRHPDAVLVVAGEGPERRALEGLAAELGVGDALFLPGRAGDVAAHLARADLLVHPSRWEGFGLVLLEAMLASVPVVATRVSSIPEIVADGETGVLVPPEDPQALADALARVLDDPGTLGAAGRARALEHFSAEAMARRTAAVYAEAIRTTASAHDSTV